MNLVNFEIGSIQDFKFGLITYEVCKLGENLFEINDTSSGWVSTEVTLMQLIKILDGRLCMSTLNWN